MKKTIYVTVLVILIIFFIFFQIYLHMNDKTVEGVTTSAVEQSAIDNLKELLTYINTIDKVKIITESGLGSKRFSLNDTKLYTISGDVEKEFEILAIQNMFLNVKSIEISTFNATTYGSILLANNQTFPGKVEVTGPNPGDIDFEYLINYFYIFLLRNLTDLKKTSDTNFKAKNNKDFVGPAFAPLSFEIMINGVKNPPVLKTKIDEFFKNVTKLTFSTKNADKKKALKLDLYNGMLPVTPITLKTSYTSTM